MRVNREQLNDEALLARSEDLVKQIAECTSALIGDIAEIDRRGAYTRRACTSTRDYCETVLFMSRTRARARVEVAQLSQRLPGVLGYLTVNPRDGIHLEGLVELAPHLTAENADSLLPRAVDRTRPQIKALIASFNADQAREDGKARDDDAPRDAPPAPAALYRTICFNASPALQADLTRARDTRGDQIPAADVASIIGWSLRTALEATATNEERQSIDAASAPPSPPRPAAHRVTAARCAECDRAMPRTQRSGRARAASDSPTRSVSPSRPGSPSGSAATPASPNGDLERVGLTGSSVADPGSPSEVGSPESPP